LVVLLPLLDAHNFTNPMSFLTAQIGIYKALLDTASGLDYLHSIGVLHGKVTEHFAHLCGPCALVILVTNADPIKQ
jgi:hypothetical protein